jgi:DNA-binding NtrC family response regulator
VKTLPAQVDAVNSIEAAINILDRSRFHVIVYNIGIGDAGSDDFLRAVKSRKIAVPVIVVAEKGNSILAERYHAAGAFDYIVGPINQHVLVRIIHRALLRSGLILPAPITGPTAKQPAGQFPFLVGTSKPIMEVFRLIAKVAEADTNVCVYGESGTGKELVARAIHYSSHRSGRPLIVCDCAAIPEGLMESEMFGHVKGSFTSALADRDGVFQLANGGSLFLDEIGELGAPLQAKLLRVIQSREFRKVGGKDSIKVDVRIIAATNKNLTEMVNAKAFREDLFYRLDVLSLVLPPLRDRKEDIPLLVDHFIQRFNRHNQIQISGVSPKTMGALLRYHWPGNIRELENCIERAAVMSDGDTLNIEELSQFLRPVRGLDQQPIAAGDNVLPLNLKEAERELILRALRGAEGDRVQAAKILGISIRTLYYKLKGIEGHSRPSLPTSGMQKFRWAERSLAPPGKRA